MGLQNSDNFESEYEKKIKENNKIIDVNVHQFMQLTKNAYPYEVVLAMDLDTINNIMTEESRIIAENEKRMKEAEAKQEAQHKALASKSRGSNAKSGSLTKATDERPTYFK